MELKSVIFFHKTTALTHTVFSTFPGFSEMGLRETGFGEMGLNRLNAFSSDS